MSTCSPHLPRPPPKTTSPCAARASRAPSPHPLTRTARPVHASLAYKWQEQPFRHSCMTKNRQASSESNLRSIICPGTFFLAVPLPPPDLVRARETRLYQTRLARGAVPNTRLANSKAEFFQLILKLIPRSCFLALF